MSFTSMHNDYLDPDRAGLNDEQPIDLCEDGTLKGYGRRGHGLNGKDADLDAGGQNHVKQAWWFADGTIRVSGLCYASIVPGEDWTEAQMDAAQETVCGCHYSGEWDGDYWVLSRDYILEIKYENDDDKDEAANIEEATRVAYEAIRKDSEAFEQEMAGIIHVFDDIDKDVS